MGFWLPHRITQNKIMKFKGFDKQSQKLKKYNQLDKRFTSDGTEFTMEDVPDNGVIMIMDEVMYFPEGVLAGKIYYPTSIEGKILYPSAPYSKWPEICSCYGVEMPDTATAGVEGEAIAFWEWVYQKCLPVTLLDCPWEVLRLLSKNVLAAYRVPFTNRARENRDFRK